MAVNSVWQATGWLDRAIILLVLAASLLGIGLVLGAEKGAEVVIEQDGRVVFAAPLGQADLADIDGPLGVTRVRISDGSVSVVAASCPERLCMAMGPVQRAGHAIACLPNRVLIRVVGGEKEQRYDLLSQ